jgi:glycosyltransferase involved in cell wall biosynthesis
MRACGLTHNDVVVVEPGTDPAPLAKGSGSRLVHLLCVATINPGKGHVTLLEALATLPHRRWRLTCAGDLTRDPETTARVRGTVSRLGLDEHVSLVGELSASELEEQFSGADVMVLASLRETFGMAVAEALARGLPVVATATGAIPILVGHEAGLVVPPSNVSALSTALACMIDDQELRTRCAGGARRVRERLPDWDAAAARMVAALAA